MPSQNQALEEYKINIEMWKHYDNLRQEKNKTFLTVNTILVATLGFLLKDGMSSDNVAPIASTVALLGAIVCVLWFFLQTRNAKYIKYHILQTLEIEKSSLEDYTTFNGQQETMKCGHKFHNLDENIDPAFVNISTNWIDRILSGVMSISWSGFAVYFLLFEQAANKAG